LLELRCHLITQIPLNQAHLATGRVEQIGAETEFRNHHYRKDDHGNRNHCVDNLLIRATCPGFCLFRTHIIHLHQVYVKELFQTR
jgi:hypothetical protein